MFQISEVQEAPAFNGRRSFLTLRACVLLRIILTEREREIAGPGWCVCADGLGRSPASDGNRTASGQIGEESTG
jgi:hypothetical protein